MNQLPRELRKIVQKSGRICVSTGAGMSAECGIPTFRGNEGLWRKFKAEDLATPDAFAHQPQLVWEWYLWRRQIVRKAEPHAGHFALADWEKRSKRFSLVTQNVDGLHSRAGSMALYELHGNLMDTICTLCDFRADLDPDLSQLSCPQCGKGKVRPGVVWFGESLPQDTFQAAFDAAVDCDLFICVGSSNVVYPAAQLPKVAKEEGAITIEINPSPSSLSENFDFYIPGAASAILPLLAAT